MEESIKLPLFPTQELGTPNKTKMVDMIEAIATMTGEDVMRKQGLRLYGGHTMRVTGAQTLAAHGIEVSKIRIMARHSSDAIMRYVADAPLTTLKADLGLAEPSNQPAVQSVDRTYVDTRIQKALETME